MLIIFNHLHYLWPWPGSNGFSYTQQPGNQLLLTSGSLQAIIFPVQKVVQVNLPFLLKCKGKKKNPKTTTYHKSQHYLLNQLFAVYPYYWICSSKLKPCDYDSALASHVWLPCRDVPIYKSRKKLAVQESGLSFLKCSSPIVWREKKHHFKMKWTGYLGIYS